jgi:uncharacterized membrane protein
MTPVLVQVSALGFALAFLLYPLLHSANAYEFHPTSLAIPLLLYAFYFLRQRRVALFLLFIILTMSAKEVLPLVTLALGLYILIVRREWVLGAVTIVLSLVWFVVAVFAIIPHFSPETQSRYFTLNYYSWLGGSGGEILVRLITHPELIWQRLVSRIGPSYVAGILGPLAYLPVLGLPVLLLAIPTLALNALSNESLQYTPGVYYHYLAPIVPFVIIAAIDGASFLTRHLDWLTERTRPANPGAAKVRSLMLLLLAVLVLAASAVAQRRHGYLPLSRDFYLPDNSKRAAAIEAIKLQVLPGASVSVGRRPASRFSQRENLYLYPEQPDADFQVIAADNPDWQYPPRDRHDAIQSSLQDGQYGVRDGRHGLLLLEQGLEQATIPDRFYDFVRADDPSPQYEVSVDLSDDLRLTGFDVVWERPSVPRAYLTLYWQAKRPIDRDLRLFYLQTDPSGELLPGTELEFAESVWYPPSRWSSSEVIRTETFHWQLAYPEQFGVAVGVVEGPGFWEVDKRLRPSVLAAPWDLRLLHGDTLVWLVTLNVDDQFVELEEPGGQSSE